MQLEGSPVNPQTRIFIRVFVRVSSCVRLWVLCAQVGDVCIGHLFPLYQALLCLSSSASFFLCLTL